MYIVKRIANKVRKTYVIPAIFLLAFSLVFTGHSQNADIAAGPLDPKGNRDIPGSTRSVREKEGSLVFSDEFEYEGSPDPDKWHHQVIGPENGHWFNKEEQHYTARPENSYVSEGTLKIRAAREEYTSDGVTKYFTSARLNSKFAFTYGRVEVRAKLPSEAGTWPAIWTLGANINEKGNYFGKKYGSVGWPACGEIDIMEQKGGSKDITQAYFHWGDVQTGTYHSEGSETTVPDSTEEFHLYAVEWDAASIKVYVDDTLIHQLPNTNENPYDNPHYLLLNVAMGGALGGEIPDHFSEGIMEVDYVRVYENP